MMTIADIFDALTASDRPYKKAVPVDRALGIVEAEVKAGKLDAELFQIFVGGEIYKAVV
jgi:HD-GYP domain-containing protein (c-di-GMP phosphodiesterase class II)